MTADDRSTATAATTATVGAFAMIASQVGGKAVRDALFLSSFGIEALPTMIVGAAAFSVLAAIAASRLLVRHGPLRAAPLAYWISATTLLAIWPLVWISPAIASLTLYLHLSVGGSVLISWFWSVINERFDPRTARRRIARVAGGGTLGGIAGGVLAERTAALETVPGSAILPLLALLQAACAVALHRARRGAPTAPRAARIGEKDDGWPAGFRTIRRVSYLRHLALLVLVLTVATALVDFLFKSQATSRFSDTTTMLRFFALFYTGTALITFFVQSTLARRLLDTIGLARTAAILPSAIGIGAAFLLVPGLFGMWTATALRGSESILRSSVFRSSYELFYTPVSPRDKRAAKTLIDVGFERLGDALGGGLIHLVLLIGALTAVTGVGGTSPGVLASLAALALALGLTGLFLALRLDRGYVTALEKSLLERAVTLDPDSVEDQTTRTALLRTIADVRLSGPSAARPAGSAPQERREVTPSPPMVNDPLLARLAELRSLDADRIRAALAAPLERPLVPHVVRLLGRDDLADDVLQALRRDCDRHAGTILDSLLDADEDFVIRRRVPRALAAASSRRVLSGLTAGLRDRRFEVRFQCSAALAHIRDREADVQLDPGPILDAVRREVAVDRRVWQSHRLLDRLESGEHTPFVDELLRERSGRSLEHVFTMLSLVFPKEPLQIAYRGLHTDDANLRGTALEYLESILPANVRENLWPLLSDDSDRGGHDRSEQEILDSLLKSHDSIRVNLEALQKREAAQSDESSDT